MHYLALGTEKSRWYLGLFLRGSREHGGGIKPVFKIFYRHKEPELDFVRRICDEAREADQLHNILASEPYQGASIPRRILEQLQKMFAA